jgi:hypothetical protein
VSGGFGAVARRVRSTGSPGTTGRPAARVVLAGALAFGVVACSGSTAAAPDPAGTATAPVAADGVQTADLAGLRKLAALAGKRFLGGVVLYDGINTLPMGNADGRPLWAVPLSTLWLT